MIDSKIHTVNNKFRFPSNVYKMDRIFTTVPNIIRFIFIKNECILLNFIKIYCANILLFHTRVVLYIKFQYDTRGQANHMVFGYICIYVDLCLCQFFLINNNRGKTIDSAVQTKTHSQILRCYK